MPQTILSFDIETTNEKLTPRAGIAIFGEYLKGMNLEHWYVNPISHTEYNILST